MFCFYTGDGSSEPCPSCFSLAALPRSFLADRHFEGVPLSIQDGSLLVIFVFRSSFGWQPSSCPASRHPDTDVTVPTVQSGPLSNRGALADLPPTPWRLNETQKLYISQKQSPISSDRLHRGNFYDALGKLSRCWHVGKPLFDIDRRFFSKRARPVNKWVQRANSMRTNAFGSAAVRTKEIFV